MSKEKKRKLRPDANELAHRAMLEATGQAEKTPPPGERTDEDRHAEAVKRGSRGGKKGGPARAANLTDEQLTDAAITAAFARWKKKDT